MNTHVLLAHMLHNFFFDRTGWGGANYLQDADSVSYIILYLEFLNNISLFLSNIAISYEISVKVHTKTG